MKLILRRVLIVWCALLTASFIGMFIVLGVFLFTGGPRQLTPTWFNVWGGITIGLIFATLAGFIFALVAPWVKKIWSK